MTASVRLWSTTPASNSGLDTGANWPEGMAPSDVNNAARGTQAAVRKMLNDLSAKIIAGGSANAITLTTDSGWVSGDLANGAALMFRAANTNSSATVTIAVDGLAAKNVYREDGTALRIGDIVANGIYQVAYSATAGGFLLLNGTLPSLSGARELLTASRTYYVRTDGSDSNTGLVNSSGGAFLTIQKAINTVLTLDLNGNTVTIQVADGTYTGATSVTSPFIGGTVLLQGNTGTPANCIISTTSADAITVSGAGAALSVAGFKPQTTTSGLALRATKGGVINVTGAMNYGACAQPHMQADFLGNITVTSAYTISGAAAIHAIATAQGQINIASITVTISGTPAFSTAFMVGTNMGLCYVPGLTFSGSATGTRYLATNGGGIFTNGGGASYLAGNSAGSATSPGWYA